MTILDPTKAMLLEVDRVKRGRRTNLLLAAVVLPGYKYEWSGERNIVGPYRVTWRQGRQIIQRHMVDGLPLNAALGSNGCVSTAHPFGSEPGGSPPRPEAEGEGGAEPPLAHEPGGAR